LRKRPWCSRDKEDESAEAGTHGRTDPAGAAPGLERDQVGEICREHWISEQTYYMWSERGASGISPLLAL